MFVPVAFDAFNQADTGDLSKTVAARNDQDTASLVFGCWWDGGDIAATLTTKSDEQRMPDKANAQLVMQPAHTFKVRGGCEGGGKGYLGSEEAAFTVPLLKGSPTSGGRPLPAIATAMQIRRLTPVECERLQGFPDGYTNIPWRNKAESPDGPRYKALGNSMAVPVMRWIGKRINEVSKL